MPQRRRLILSDMGGGMSIGMDSIALPSCRNRAWLPNEPTWVQHAAVRQGGLPVGDKTGRRGTHLCMTRASLGVRAHPTTPRTLDAKLSPLGSMAWSQILQGVSAGRPNRQSTFLHRAGRPVLECSEVRDACCWSSNGSARGFRAANQSG